MLGLEHVVLRICAAMFGTSGHSQRPTGLVTDLYLSRNHSRNSDQHKVVGALEAHTSMHTQTCTHVPCVLCAVCCVLCAVCCVLCAVCCVLCAVCCVLCAVCCVLCARTTSDMRMRIRSFSRAATV